MEGLQRFLERLDTQERKSNVVITGVPEKRWRNSDDDASKIGSVFDAIGCSTVTDYTSKRIGKPGTADEPRSHPRPLLVALKAPEERKVVMNNARKLSTAGDHLKDIRIKKDQHPAIRKEWRRLFQAEEAEKTKPENAGHDIHLGRAKRQVIRDGQVIDGFFPIL